MRQIFLNSVEDCNWLRETHLADNNLNNANPIPGFKSFCLTGNEDCPKEILIYADEDPNVTDKPARAMLMDNGCYSFFKV